MNIYDSLTAAELSSSNPVIPSGDLWVERDTGYAKRGTGAAWNSTSYWEASPSPRLSGAGPSLYGLAGEYWSYPTVRTTSALVAGTLYTHPVWVPATCVVDRIGAEVTVAASGSTITLGAYADDGTGSPGVLVFDAGTIDGNSATAQEKTVSVQLRGGRTYHLAALCAGGTPTVRIPSATSAGFTGRQITLANATAAGTTRYGRTQTSVVGTALPGPAVTTALTTTLPIIAVRFA